MLDFILDWLYPPKCLVCENLIAMDKPRYFCQSCSQNIETLQEPLCIKCGGPANNKERTSNGNSMLCPECAGKSFAFERNYAMFAYDEMFRQMIHRFKYGKHPEYGVGLGKIMAEAVDSAVFSDIDRIIPVPIHKKRKQERGFNQSALLAREISKARRIPADERALVRVKHTKPQSSLGRAGRENNVKDAFAVSNKNAVAYKKILLIDDIYTTGCTLNACAAALRKAGAGKVICATLAIAVKNYK